MITVIILLGVLSFLLIWQFVGYPVLMAVVATLSKPENKNYDDQPFVSVIVPAYNEERVIEKRIDNLLSMNYPKDKYEIIVVESGSTDNTYDIVEGITEHHAGLEPSLKLVKEQERKGKASAINLGKKHARGDIVLVTDANSIFDNQVIEKIAKHFADSKVGGVGGRHIVSNPDNNLASSESFYLNLEYIIRRGESALDSACTFHGEINAWRKEIVEADTKMLSEDLDMAVQIRRAGYKIDYEPDAVVYEPVATTAREQITERKRMSIGVIQCIFKHLDYFLLPRDLYSLLIFPSHRILAMLSPFMLLAIPILYFIAWDARVVAAHLILTALVFAALFGILLLLKSKLAQNDRTKLSSSISSMPGLVYYVLLNEYIILLAWKSLTFGKYSVLWQKAETTR